MSETLFPFPHDSASAETTIFPGNVICNFSCKGPTVVVMVWDLNTLFRKECTNISRPMEIQSYELTVLSKGV